jgi:uncharacterized protein YjiS (DUF1127 family)
VHLIRAVEAIAQRLEHSMQNDIIARPARPRLLARAAGRLLRNLKRRLAARRTIRTLHGLSDLQLKDIGMHRSEIHRFGRDAANPANGLTR